MINYDLFTWFFITSFLMALSPGPAVFLILGQGMKYGVRASMLGAIGIEVVNTSYFILSALGMSAVLAANPLVFTILKWAGIAYLFYTGIRTLASAKAGNIIPKASPTGSRFLVDGIVTQAANPKAIIYFSAMLPQFVDLQKPVTVQITILGATAMATEYIILTAYGWFAQKGATFLPGPKAVLWQERIAGISLIAVALILTKN
ncbi:LysE family translocator [bacterium]|nr:LysE family translocator [bacterium]